MRDPVTSVMSRAPICVQTGTSATDTAVIMRNNDIGDVLVTNEGQLVGIVTDRDLVVRGLAEGLDPQESPVGILATPAIAVLGPEASVTEAVRAMREHAVRRLPVCDSSGRPIGIVSLGDLAENLDPTSALADISAAPPVT